MAYLVGKAFDYNDFVKQVRGFCQGHPQVWKPNDRQAQSGIAISGTGDGELYVSTEAYTPSGPLGSPSGSPGPGILYRLTCTVAGSAVSSPKAQFTVEQVDGASPGLLGTLTAGERWAPDTDDPQYVGSPLGSPGLLSSPQHGLRLILTTSVAWAVSDTIEFRLVDHNIGPNTDHNWIEQRFTQTGETGDNFNTEWIARAPTIANAGGSPQSEVYYGMRTSFSVAQNYFNVAVMGADGFEPSSNFQSQPNSSGRRYMFLDDSPFPFWVMCDADGLWACARPSAIYEHCTMQLIDVFATGNQHPKPMYIGAMSEIGTLNFAEVDNDRHAACFDPGEESTGLFRWVDGTWYEIQNRANNYTKNDLETAPVSQSPSQDGFARILAPYRAFYGVNHLDGQFDGETGVHIQSLSRGSVQFLPRYDGSYELIPITLIIRDPQRAVVGDLKYVKYVTGQGLNPEDTTTDTSESPNRDYIAFQNANLSNRDNFVAMELVDL